MIELTNENIKNIKYDDVIAFTIAEGGAMGEPNGFYVVTKELLQYHLNFGTTDIKEIILLEQFPILKTFSCFVSQVTNLEKGWNWFSMGFGNYLIVKNEYYDKVKDYIETNLGEDWKPGELYQKWFDVIKIIKNMKGDKEE